MGVESCGPAAAFDGCRRSQAIKTQLLFLVLAARYGKPTSRRPIILNWALVALFADIAVWILNPDEPHQVDAISTTHLTGVFRRLCPSYFSPTAVVTTVRLFSILPALPRLKMGSRLRRVACSTIDAAKSTPTVSAPRAVAVAGT